MDSKFAEWLKAMRLIAFLSLIAALDPGTAAAQDRSALILIAPFKARSIGPANMGGRICDIAVDPKSSSVIFVASATGGLWKSVNRGTSWTSLLDSEGVWSVGSVAISPADSNVIWAGSGEGNPRNSVSWGDGIYRSSDGGATWVHVGLRDTMHIGRIVPHPTQSDVAFVAALGHVWGANRERGLFKTTDAGKTWQHVLAIDDSTGCCDIALDPSNPDTVFAAAWEFRRGPYSGGNPRMSTGTKSGIFRSTNGGQSWVKLTEGLPSRPLGRIGLAIDPSNSKRILAVIPTDRTPTDNIGGRQKQNTGDLDLGGVFTSQDGGDSWSKLNDLCPRPFYYGQIRIDPRDPDRVYVLGVQFFTSEDGGKNFRGGAPGTHADHHALWIDPRDSSHLIDGNDGGLYFSFDRGKSWEHSLNLPISQFYGVAADSRAPYRIYGGLQDNGIWTAPSRTRGSDGITVGDWGKVMGADGFRCQVDPKDPDTVYFESQYGRLRRYDVTTGRIRDIQPKAAKDAPAYRFNWNAPLLVSSHDSKTVYFGGNHVFRSKDRGESWEPISSDLTSGRPGPDPASGHTLTALAESPLQADRLLAGTDDGRLWGTTDSGKTWTELSNFIPGPKGQTFNAIEPSHAMATRFYVGFSRHRLDDRTAYLFRSDDGGMSWKNAASGLPGGAVVHVIRESPRNPNLLFAGTELGLFVSFDAGNSWSKFHAGMPPVPVFDLVIHPRERELIIATHGRGVFIVDIRPLEELTDETLAKPAHLFDVRDSHLPNQRPSSGLVSPRFFVGENPGNGAVFWVYQKEAQDACKLEIRNGKGRKVIDLPVKPQAGLQMVSWNLRSERSATSLFVLPGDFRAVLTLGDKVQEKQFRVEGRAAEPAPILDSEIP